MSYTIYHADGTPVPVPNAIIDSVYYNATGGSTGTGLGIQLIGDRAVDYGGPIAQNFLQMTENFASNAVPSDTTSLQGQLWFNKISSTSGDLFVRKTSNTSGGVANWEKLVTSIGGVIAGNISGNAASATTSANVTGGSAGSLVYQANAGATAFIPSSTTGYVLTSTGPATAPTWQAPIAGAVTSIIAGTNITISPTDGLGAVTVNSTAGGTVTSVGVTTTPSRITVSGSPVTVSGDIALDLATTAVTAGVYTSANITVDEYGRITSAANGASGSGLGYGQTWQSVSRSSGVTYINVTGKPIMLAITSNAGGAFNSHMVISIDGGAYFGFGGGIQPNGGAYNWSGTVIVPDAATYVVSAASIISWYELR